jgi:hypothetical protein
MNVAEPYVGPSGTFPMHRPRSELEWHATFDSVGSGREAEAFPIGPAEMRLTGKAGGDRNLGQLHVGLGDKTAGSVEPHVAVVKHRPLSDELSEEAIELALRHAKAHADLRYR